MSNAKDVLCTSNSGERIPDLIFSGKENNPTRAKFDQDVIGLGISNVEMLPVGRRPLQRLDTDCVLSFRVPVIKRVPSLVRSGESRSSVPVSPEKESRSEAIRAKGGTATNPTSTEEQIEQRIDGILSTVPADIRFAKDGPLEIPKRSKGSSVVDNTPTKSHRQISLTITPAYQREKRAANLNPNSDIKLYHLSRTDQLTSAPVKLFLRLVGKDRVMVRVGGGWADLGDVSYNLYTFDFSGQVC